MGAAWAESILFNLHQGLTGVAGGFGFLTEQVTIIYF